MNAAATFLSVADIAHRLNVPRHRVVYVLAVYSIPPAVRIGHTDNACTGYDETGFEKIRERLSSDRRESISEISINR